jgi:hypothetical protein
MKAWPLLLLLISTTAIADIGAVTEVTGAATVKRGSTSITVIKGTLVEMNDRIETKSGVVNIKFKDDTTVKVTEHSALVIDDFVYDPKTQGGKLGLKTAQGTVRYVSGAIAHNNPNAVNIKTPTAAIAVRGTDFVMSVDETGKSLVMLMPTCEDNVQMVNLRGLVCGSGKIDVESGGEIIHLDSPYQATLVETMTTAPTPPIVVNLSNVPIGNNLHISPPQTMTGASVIVAAKAAAQKTGDSKSSNSNNGDKKEDKQSQVGDSNNTPSGAETTTTQEQQKQQAKAAADQTAADAQAAKSVVDIAEFEKSTGVKVKDTVELDPNVFAVFQNNNPMLNQIGWGYASLSQNGHNYANVSLETDTKILVYVTQDRLSDAYNFNGTNSKAIGSITITQTYK